MFGSSREPGSLGELRALPEAALTYPGSEVIDSGGRNPSTGVEGRVSAAAWQVLGVDAGPQAIEAFYATELSARGWMDGAPGTSSGIGTVEELITQAWSKDGVVFRLGIRDPAYWDADPELFSRYLSIYDARLIGDYGQRVFVPGFTETT